MNKAIIISVLLVFTACNNHPNNESSLEESSHLHEAESASYTIYSEQLEFFIEHAPLVVGEEAEFLVHITDLATYKPASTGNVTILIDGVSVTSGEPATPGIFHVPFIPGREGAFHAEFIYKEEGLSQAVEEHLQVYKDHDSLLADGQVEESHAHESESAGEITFLKEQAWKAEFMVMEVQSGPFNAVIPTSGEFMSMPGEKKNITAGGHGIIRFADPLLVPGSTVQKGQLLFMLSSETLVEDNVTLRYKEAKNMLEKSRSEYNRHLVLYAQQTISERQFQASKSTYVEDSLRYYSLASNISEEGIRVTAAVSGTIHELNVSDGEYTEPGRILAILSSNKTLMLRADLPQQYYSQLHEIRTAHFRPAYTDRIFTMEELNGSLLAAGVSVAENDHYLPVIFRLENNGDLLEGAFAEVFLIAGKREDLLSVPSTALGEEQGGYYVYVQVTGESYTKRSVSIGANNGLFVEITSGLKAGERVVTQGVMLVKAASMSTGAIQDGHSH